MTFQGAAFGDDIVAANAVLMSFFNDHLLWHGWFCLCDGSHGR